MKTIIAGLAALFVASTAAAEEPTIPYEYFTAAEMDGLCANQAELCAGYIAGVLGINEAARVTGRPFHGLCAPVHGANLADLMKAVVAYNRATPDNVRTGRLAGPMIADALAGSYCRKP